MLGYTKGYSFGGYNLVTDRNIGTQKLVIVKRKCKPNRGIVEHIKTTITVANGEFFRDDIHKIIYCHPDDLKRLEEAVKEQMQNFQDNLIRKNLLTGLT